MITKILLPTDGSAFSDRAADYALHLAKKYSASLTALNVVEIAAPQELNAESVDKKHAHQAEMTLKAVQEKAGKEGVQIETKMLVSRSVSDAIMEEAEEGSYNLIVIGSHGRRGLQKLLLGSVAESIIRQTTRPVLVIH